MSIMTQFESGSKKRVILGHKGRSNNKIMETIAIQEIIAFEKVWQFLKKKSQFLYSVPWTWKSQVKKSEVNTFYKIDINNSGIELTDLIGANTRKQLEYCSQTCMTWLSDIGIIYKRIYKIQAVEKSSTLITFSINTIFYYVIFMILIHV